MDYKSGTSPSLAGLLDDSLFGPPALSAYSIAILNARSSSQDRPSTHSDAETRHNADLKASLKRKFSVHFGESPPTLPPASGRLLGSANSSSVDLDDAAHAASPGLTCTPSSSVLGRLGHSPHTSNSLYTNHSITSHHSPHRAPSPPRRRSVGPGDCRDPHASLIHPREPFRDRPGVSSPSRPRLFGRSSATTLSPPQLFVGHTMKRSKLSHNLRSLGPPKRAFEAEAALLVANDYSIELGRLQDALGPVLALRSPGAPLRSPAGILSDKAGTAAEAAQLSTLHRKPAAAALASPGLDFFRTLESWRKTRPAEASLQVLSEQRRALQSLRTISTKTEEEPGQKSGRTTLALSPVHLLLRSPLHDIFASANAPRPPTFVKPTVQHPGSKGSVQGDIAVPDTCTASKSKKMIVVNSQPYEKLDILGRGGSSKVYRVRHAQSRKIYALKKVELDEFDESSLDGFKREIEHLQKLKKHPRVVALQDHAIQDGALHLVMECGEIDLSSVLQHRMAALPQLDVQFVRFHALELFRCVQAVHKAGIVHSDLKPANFLFVKGLMKIIDFGIANTVPDHTVNIYRELQIGTPNYMAPESLIEVGQASCPAASEPASTWRVGKPADVWSCGCILYQMVYGRPPYAVYQGQSRLKAIMDPHTKIVYADRGLGGVKVPHSAIILMQGCLDRVPSSRWSVEECLELDFLAPKVVSRSYVRDLVFSAINFGLDNKERRILKEEYDEMIETVVAQIQALNFA